MSEAPARPCNEIPVAHTPPGGYGAEMPPPILAGCRDPLADGEPVPSDHPAWRHFQRIEQCADRIVITGGGIVHDMRCDGTEANGVNDVAEFDFTTPITVVATYEDGVHVLRPVGLPIEVTRHREGDQLAWKYLMFTARLERIGEP